MEKLAVARFRLALYGNFGHLRTTTTTPPASTTTPPPIMDPTTLVTFLFRAPPEARTVELLGSWDNFAQAYQMHHDRRRGIGFWSGCFKFDNIIFDGHTPCWSKPRNGGLKQGGTYWYYYRLNDELEAYDKFREHTTMCPLLPGQPVNVLDVPTELVDPPARCRSASPSSTPALTTASSTHTLDPDDKFAALEPPPVSRVHGRCVSELALGGRLESDFEPVLPSLFGPSSSCPMNMRPASRAGVAPLCSNPDSAYAEGRSSRYSSRSCQSPTPSFTHSSAMDEYREVSSIAGDDDKSVLLDWPRVLHSSSHTTSSRRHRGWLGRDFGSRSASKRRHVNFDTEKSLLNDAGNFDDLPFEAPRSAPTTCFSLPLRNHPMHDMRPVTSYGEKAERNTPRLYSLANDVLLSDSTIVPCQASRRVSRLPSNDSYSSIIETTFSVRSDSFSSDVGSLDLCSPTFTADTLSSAGGGLNTPLRLSLAAHHNHHQSSTGSSNTNTNPSTNYAATSSVERVAERLRLLGMEEQHQQQHLQPTSIIFERETEYSPPPAFVAYALPTNAGGAITSSAYTLKEDKSSKSEQQSFFAPTSAQDVFLPQGRVVAEEDASFADGIFSELAYLGEVLVETTKRRECFMNITTSSSLMLLFILQVGLRVDRFDEESWLGRF